ncbi:MAG: DUF1311 domain-containing protein [Alphaproteobacteria bacterium]|nr:DUF1311 domain-containing protein [Alphaproteobacteria bacterium]
MKALLFVVAAAFGFAGTAFADAPLYPKQDCEKVIHSATAFHKCYAANLDAANKALNRVYKGLLAQKVFYVGSAEGLRDVERAWVVYKDKECAYEYGAFDSGNEDYWLAYVGCEIRKIDERIVELKGRPSCTGGNSVCTPHIR